MMKCVMLPVAVLAVLGSLALAADSPMIRDAYSITEQLTREEVIRARTNTLTYGVGSLEEGMRAVHQDGPIANRKGEEANFINDISKLVNAKERSELLVEGEIATNNAILLKLEEICPTTPIDCNKIDLTFRPVNEICNNLQRPRVGTANIAQARIAPALYEDSVLISPPMDNLIDMPMDPYGVRMTNPLNFLVSGETGVRMTVLNPKIVCNFVTLNFKQFKQISGNINSATVIKEYISGACTLGSTFHIEGNILSVNGSCAGVFNVCFQKPHIELNLQKEAGKESTLAIDGNIVSRLTNPIEMFGVHEPQQFHMVIEGGKVFVGRGGVGDISTTIMGARTTIPNVAEQLQNQRYSMTMAPVQARPVQVDVPVREVMRVESNGNSRGLLEGLEFLFEDNSMMFGMERAAINNDIVRIDMIDDSDGAILTALMSPTLNALVYFDENNVRQSLSVMDPFEPTIIDPLLDILGNPHNEFAAMWMSCMNNVGYIGIGNVVGRDVLAGPVDMAGANEFKATRVELRSSNLTEFMFDVAKPGVPRQTAVSGLPLPTARDVSLTVHSNIHQPVLWSDTLTMAVMQMGQFVDHDGVLSPLEEVETEAEKEEPIRCCVDGKPIPNPSKYCFNIEITNRTDPRGSQGAFPFPEFKCLPFTRSVATLSCDSPFGDLRVREQTNAITAFIDGSNIYGSTLEVAIDLREAPDGTGARLRTSARQGAKELPGDPDPEEECRNEDLPPDFLCHAAGDVRTNEQPGLTAIHALWVREHNRIVNTLRQHFSGFSENNPEEREFLYQSARRIVIAEYQVIVYEQYLRSFMDDHIHSLFQLGIGECTYDPIKFTPDTPNEWGLANRIGHTWINPALNGTNTIPLVDGLESEFLNPELINRYGSDIFLRNLYLQACPETDRIIEDVVTENLFRLGHEALDLAALNVQRGRDHGVSYTRTREALGLPVPETFQEAANIGLFSPENAKLLASCYDAIGDIDLFTGVVTELPLKVRKGFEGSTSTIGETLNFIQGSFFQRAKCGDRYWYEFEDALFTPLQIKLIQNVTFSSILCQNVLNVNEIQENAFLVPGIHNPIVRCDQIPHLDLRQFPPLNLHKRELEQPIEQESAIEQALTDEAKRAELDASVQELLKVLEEIDEKYN